MSESDHVRRQTIKPGITFFPVGVFLLLSGLGRSGWVWEHYSIWDPISTLGIFLIAIAFALPFWKKFDISFTSSGSNNEKGIRNLLFFIIFMIGIPVVSVVTREMSIMIDPLSLYIGLVVCFSVILFFGFDKVLLSLSLILFAFMFLPAAGQGLANPNPLNDNMIEAFWYSLSMGIFFSCWGILSIYRRNKMNINEPEFAGV